MAPTFARALFARGTSALRRSTTVSSTNRYNETLTSTTASNKTAIDWTIYTHGLNGVNNGENSWLSHMLYYSLCCMLFMLMVFRLQHFVLARIRRLFLIHSREREALRYWATPANRLVSFAKKHILWAPIGRRRHNRENYFMSVVSFGTLPTRLQAVLLLAYFGSNVAYCTVWLDLTQPKPELIAEFRGRAGVIAVVNMVPLFLLAGRNNPLISLLGISFDTWNLIHRWIGRIVVLESFAHVTAWSLNEVDLTGWSGMRENLRVSPFFRNGFIAGAAFFAILLQSPSPIRHAAYEVFLHLHILLASLGIFALFNHLHIDRLPQMIYLFVIISIWSYDRLARLFRILYRNCGNRLTRFRIEALPGGDGACRVDIELVRPWRYTPGSHAYVYIPWISFWQSHPFSIAWSNDEDRIQYLTRKAGQDTQKRESSTTDVGESTPKELSMISRWGKRKTLSMVIAKRQGMTKSLWEMANRSPNKTMYLSGFLEGQYGGHHKLNSYGMVVLVAGGVGITHCIGWVRELLRQWNEGAGIAQKVVLIWVVPDKEQYEWCREWFNEIFSVPGWSKLVSVQLYVTRVKGDTVTSPSTNVASFVGRPNWDNLFGGFVEEKLGTIGVTVCGPGTLSDSIRLAVRKQIHNASIDFLEESFTW